MNVFAFSFVDHWPFLEMSDVHSFTFVWLKQTFIWWIIIVT